MRNPSLLFAPPLLALLTACSMQMPRSADEFRSQLQANPNTMGVRVEKFEVNGSNRQVAQFVKKKSEQCLKKTVRIQLRTSSGGIATSASDYLVQYQPRAEISATKATVYTVETITNLQGKPKQEPYYTFVADFIPVSSNKTRVELHYVWGKPRPRVAEAVRAWAAGRDAGCPSLAL